MDSRYEYTGGFSGGAFDWCFRFNGVVHNFGAAVARNFATAKFV